MNIQQLPPEIQQELDTLKERQKQYQTALKIMAAEREEIRRMQQQVSEKLVQVCPCPECTAARRKVRLEKASESRSREVSSDTAIILVALIFITGFVIGYLCNT